MKKCEYCGFKVKQNDTYCISCGRKTQYGIDTIHYGNDITGRDKINMTDEENTYENNNT